MELDRDEKEHIARMVASPGWRIFVYQVITPSLQAASQHIDAPNTDERQTNFYRGVKYAIKTLLERAYTCAPDTRNPFTEHAQAFLLDLKLPPTANGKRTSEELPNDVPRPRRPAHPVI